MRKKRSISAEIVQSDSMRELPAGARLAYIDLCLNADDDGFAANPKSVAAQAGAASGDLERLRAAGYVLLFPNCALICHWYKHAGKKSWRHTATAHTAELSLVELDADGVWTLKSDLSTVSAEMCTGVSTDVSTDVSTPLSKGQATGPVRTAAAGPEEADRANADTALSTPLSTDVSTEMSTPLRTEVSTGVSTGMSTGVSNFSPSRAYDNNNNIKNNNNNYRCYQRESDSGFSPPTADEVRAYCEAEGLTGVDAPYFVDYYAAKGWRIGSSPMADWRAVVRNWQLKSKERKRDAPPEKPPLRPLYKVFTKEDFL